MDDRLGQQTGVETNLVAVVVHGEERKKIPIDFLDDDCTKTTCTIERWGAGLYRLRTKVEGGREGNWGV